MDIQSEKIELAKLLLDTEDPEIIYSIKEIFRKKTRDFWDELSPEQQKEIKEGEEEMRAGKTKEYESFISKYRK
ncbi:MAG: hypothetical protein WBV11_03855 [Salegentibacter sp.]